MRSDMIRAMWKSGQPVINGWCSIPDSFAAELMAHAGWDSLTLDCQHGLIGYQAMVHMLQAISTSSAAPLVRVASEDPAGIMKALDAGAVGVICPMVSTAEACRDFIATCRYPPLGRRSSGPTRASLYGGGDYDHANRSVLAIAMIETAEALGNLDAILGTPGLDGIYVGPSDLSLALGLDPSLDKPDGLLIETLERILAACHRHGIPAGIHTNASGYAHRMIGMGFKLVTVSADTKLLIAGARATVDAMRAAPDASAVKPSAY